MTLLTDDYYDVPDGKVAMVVTHLQMTAKAPMRDIALPQGLSFEPRAGDLTWYRDIFERVGAPWLWFGRRVMPDAELEAIISDPNVALYTLSLAGRDEALLELDFRQKGECELAYFGLTEALIGTGAGRYLMNRAIDLAWSQPISRFHVHTCTVDSPQALNFYQRSGFTPYRRQVEIAEDPRLSGILPRTCAPHIPMIG